MDRQTWIYIAIGVGAVLIVSALLRSSGTVTAQPVISLPGASQSRDAAYYAGQVSKIDWATIASSINTIFGKKP